MSTDVDAKALACFLASHDDAVPGRETRAERLNLRVRESDLTMIKYAAAVCGKSVTEFLLEAAVANATTVIEGRARVVMNERDFAAFAKDLADDEPKVNAQLARAAAKYKPV